MTLEAIFESMNGKALGWDHRATPFLPDRWPLTPDTHVHSYGFAYRQGPSPTLLLASQPYAVANAGLDLLQPTVIQLTSSIEELSVQSMFPLSRDVLQRQQALPTFQALFAIARTRPLDADETKALGERYAFFRKCHGAVMGALESRHAAFFAWLDAR